MHTVALTPSLLSPVATVGALAFANDELIAFLRPRQALYPTKLREHFLRKARLGMNRPDVAVRVMVSDDSDEWWDERVGSEVLGYAIWERNGSEREGWGRDGWLKSEFLVV